MADAMIQITDAEFEDIASLVYDTFGIHLTEQKKSLVRGRLSSLLKTSRYTSFTEYLEAVRADPTGASLSNLIDRISTNHTFFFRESGHFDLMSQEILPELEARKRPSELRVWSAGCSSGEEPYTLAILFRERYGRSVGGAGPVILGTDVSLKALTLASGGVYPADRLEGVPARLQKYFHKSGADKVEVSADLRELVLFKRLNLMRESYPFRGLFDVVFCRNVMIYFDQPTRTALVERFHRYLHPGGYLLIGHSETLGRDSSLFRYVKPTVYQRWK